MHRNNSNSWECVRDERIHSLGIEKKYRCPECGKTEKRTIEERKNLVDCMMANGRGLWAFEQCPHCGAVAVTYPSAINGIPCTKTDCISLVEEMRRFADNAGEGI